MMISMMISMISTSPSRITTTTTTTTILRNSASYWLRLSAAAAAVAAPQLGCRRFVVTTTVNDATTTTSTTTSKQQRLAANTTTTTTIKHMPEFPLIYPDFIPTPIWGRRNALREELERMDMLERRMHLDIPEFYVGSIIAVTCSDANMGNRQNRFVGICINRMRQGLSHRFTLRNVIDGLGVEVMYELYNPTILKIETLKLEKRLDDDLTYLVDALPEYSTFDFHLEPVAHPAGAPVPINPLKVKMRPPPWTRRWELYDCKGIEDAWTLVTPYFKRKLHRTKVNELRKYDLIADHREAGSDLETEMSIEQAMHEFEVSRHRIGATKRRILRSVATSASNRR